MPTYARIDDGIVAELYTPPAEVSATPLAELFHVDLRWIDVSAVSPQPEPRWTYDGSVFAPPPLPPPPTLQQQAMALLSQPVTVDCLALPALDGAYPIDQATQMQITGIAAAISAGLGLPGGGATFNWPDVVGVAHTWPAGQFTEFAKAVMNYVYACAQVAQGHGTTLPAQPIVIA
ncbi:MAG: hypothetical protein WDN25_24770 [Acetobacteraceae bacterium]